MRAPKYQTYITDYFRIVKPKRGGPVSLLRSEYAHFQRFATITDLPDETLLSILYWLRLNGSDDPSLLLQPDYLDYLQVNVDIEAARRLYAVCRRFHSVFGGFAFERLKRSYDLMYLERQVDRDEDDIVFPVQQVKCVFLNSNFTSGPP